MSTIRSLGDRLGASGDGPYAAVLVALGLTVVGTVVAITVAIVAWPVAGLLGVSDSAAARILLNKNVQIGFLIVAVGYVVYRGAPGRYARFRRPTIRDAIWIAAIFPLLKAVAFVVGPVLEFLGVVTHTSGSEGVPELATQPALLLFALAVWFLFAAPAEELLFRGVVQGRLREAFDVVPALVLAAGCFALMHVPMALLSEGMGPVLAVVAETFVGGLVFGLAYERTGNLVVPSVAHATLWAGGIVEHYLSVLTAGL
ncbi:CPBP family intramembrane metalloprotease [Halobacteria archaeon HArc-gm2]|nr:CPBP family intramembrane metalloprotease [Halobacteria archaeon HArc-gm2]